MNIQPFPLIKSGLFALLVCVLLFQTGCGSARRGEPIAGPLPLTNPKVEQGKLVFMHHCNTCHPGGEAGLAPGINDKPLPAFLIRFQVRNGLGAMPSFSKEEISDAELANLITYLKALRRHSSGRHR